MNTRTDSATARIVRFSMVISEILKKPLPPGWLSEPTLKRPLRYGIDSPLAKRMTPQESPDAKENSLQQSLLLDRLIHIDRTGRLKTAGTGKARRNKPFVALQQDQSQRPDPAATLPHEAQSHVGAHGIFIDKAFAPQPETPRAVRRSSLRHSLLWR